MTHHVVYVVKEVTSFQGLDQLMGVVRNWMSTQPVEIKQGRKKLIKTANTAEKYSTESNM